MPVTAPAYPTTYKLAPQSSLRRSAASSAAECTAPVRSQNSMLARPRGQGRQGDESRDGRVAAPAIMAQSARGFHVAPNRNRAVTIPGKINQGGNLAWGVSRCSDEARVHTWTAKRQDGTCPDERRKVPRCDQVQPFSLRKFVQRFGKESFRRFVAGIAKGGKGTQAKYGMRLSDGQRPRGIASTIRGF